jgi:hypothetical protein
LLGFLSSHTRERSRQDWLGRGKVVNWECNHVGDGTLAPEEPRKFLDATARHFFQRCERKHVPQKPDLDKFVDVAFADTAICEEPRYSRKTKRVIVAIQGVIFSISLNRLDSAIDVASSLSDGNDPVQSLLNGLLHARQKYGHHIDGKKKPRGYSSGADFLYRVKYAAAWIYVMLRQPAEQWPKEVNAAVLAVEKELGLVGRGKPRSFQKRVYATALLVEKAFGCARRHQGFKKRTSNTDNFNPRNWYRDYIKPYVWNVRRIVSKGPASLDHLGNAYLREVFQTKHLRDTDS